MRPLSGNGKRHAVITGAAEGIGRALAEAFARHGYTITGVDVNGDLAAQTQAEFTRGGLSIQFLLADLSQPAELRRLTDDLRSGPTIDLLIHNSTMRGSTVSAPSPGLPWPPSRGCWLSI